MLLAGLGPEVRSSGDAVGFEVSAIASGTWLILIVSFSFFICQYCIGKWLARRAAHREWAAYLSFLIVNRVLWTAILLSPSLPVSMDMPMEVFFIGIEFIALFAGVERGRRLSRRLA